MSEIYQAAIRPGGKHHGLLMQLTASGVAQLRKSVESLEMLAALHDSKIADPADFVSDWSSRSPQYRQGLLAKWATEAQNFREQVEIIKEFMREHRI